MRGHPSNQALLAYWEGLKSGSPEASTALEPAVRLHLERPCALCQRRAAQFEAILASLDAPALHETPEEWVERALTWIREAEGRTLVARKSRSRAAGIRAQAGEVLAQLKAGLVLDSFAGATLPGIRGVTSLQARQLLYESQVGSVYLQIVAGAGRKLELLGQFLPADGTLGLHPGWVVLEKEGRESRRRLTQTGEFHFRSIPRGQIQLQVEWGPQVLRLDPISL